MQMEKHAWRLDPDDPRAPTDEQWSAMSAVQREHVVSSLPVDPPPHTMMGVGDVHQQEVKSTEEALRHWYRKRGERAYVGVEKAVYYPGERAIEPDVFVVLGVDAHQRSSWIVQNENDRGPDFVIEILHLGDRKKDLVGNVARYARLGIPEYFVFDVPKLQLRGWRQMQTGGGYRALLQQGGVFCSHILGMDLGIVDDRLRFFGGGAQLPDTVDLLSRLTRAVDQSETRAIEQTRLAEEKSQLAEEKTQLAEEKTLLAEDLAQQLAAMKRAFDKLKGQ